MNADFEQRYQAAERAYGLREYAEADAIASALWVQLQSAPEENDPSLVLSWRAVVSLLLGHIQLHGLDQPDEASSAYQRVLDNKPNATISAVAEQGLERCRSLNSSGEAITTVANCRPIPDLLKDPFLTTDSNQTKPERPNQATAMPWLPNDEERWPMPIPSPTPQQAVTPEADATEEMSIPEQPSSDAVDPIPQETVAQELLENSWLRVQLKPEPARPSDSVESDWADRQDQTSLRPLSWPLSDGISGSSE